MSERSELEHKKSLDLGLVADQLKLVKEIVAMANADGGMIRIGVADNGTEVGFASSLAERFDPARVADLLGRFTTPDHVELTITKAEGRAGQIVDIAVSRFPDPPLVMCRDGNHEVNGRQDIEFRKGDVYVRRGTRAQRASRADYLAWTRQACEDARRKLLDRVAFVAELPPDAQLHVAVAGANLSEPAAMLAHAVQAWQQEPTRLLGANELAWLLAGDTSLGRLDDAAARLLVHSALRKKSTLWHWLARIQPSQARIEEVIDEAMAGRDRDFTDAGRPIVDVAAVTLDDGPYQRIVAALANSAHSHFRNAGVDAADRGTQLERLRALRARPVDGTALAGLDDSSLRTLSHCTAAELATGRNLAASNRLARYGLETFGRTPGGARLG